MAAVGILLTGPPLHSSLATATRSDLALEMVEATPYDVVLCEYRTGSLSAPQLLSALAERAPSVALVILGESGDESDLVEMIRLGAAGVLTKSASTHELVYAISAVFGGHRAVAGSVARQMLDPKIDARPLPRELLATGLSPTELDILTMLGEARSIAGIAAARGISQKKVRGHVASIYRKLGLRSRSQAVLEAARMGLTTV